MNSLLKEKILVQDYFKQKFANFTRVYELEKQLADNRKHLDALKARGRDEKDLDGNDQEFEITIYRDAVQMKRNSSSSEDNDIDTSDELLEMTGNSLVEIPQDNVYNSNLTFVEKELEKEQRDRRDGQQDRAGVRPTTSAAGAAPLHPPEW